MSNCGFPVSTMSNLVKCRRRKRVESLTAERQTIDQVSATEDPRVYDAQTSESKRIPPRRLNNREIAKSVADVLMIEDVGTHQPMANLLGDTLHDGFDTHGDSLGISEFHLDQYIDAFRKVIDGVIFSGERPETRRYDVESTDLKRTSLSQRPRAEGPGRNAELA